MYKSIKDNKKFNTFEKVFNHIRNKYDFSLWSTDEYIDISNLEQKNNLYIPPEDYPPPIKLGDWVEENNKEVFKPRKIGIIREQLEGFLNVFITVSGGSLDYVGYTPYNYNNIFPDKRRVCWLTKGGSEGYYIHLGVAYSKELKAKQFYKDNLDYEKDYFIPNDYDDIILIKTLSENHMVANKLYHYCHLALGL